jgi:hypothetical protein
MRKVRWNDGFGHLPWRRGQDDFDKAIFLEEQGEEFG